MLKKKNRKRQRKIEHVDRKKEKTLKSHKIVHKTTKRVTRSQDKLYVLAQAAEAMEKLSVYFMGKRNTQTLVLLQKS